MFNHCLVNSKNMLLISGIIFFLINLHGTSCRADDQEEENLKAIEKKNSDNNNNNKNSISNQQSKNLMERILPWLIIPFLISSALIPLMLAMIKILLAKSFLVGIVAVLITLINFFRRRVDGGGVFNHHAKLAEEHYGYKGIEEPGAYINN